MKRLLTRLVALGLGLMGLMAWADLGFAAPLDDLLAGAKKEGVIDFYGPSTLGPEGAQAIVAAFNKKYGLNVKVNFTPSGNMTRDTAKVIGLSASGQPPEWDIMLVTDGGAYPTQIKKAWAELIGLPAGPVRPPLIPLTDEEKRKLGQEITEARREAGLKPPPFAL